MVHLQCTNIIHRYVMLVNWDRGVFRGPIIKLSVVNGQKRHAISWSAVSVQENLAYREYLLSADS